ADVKDSPGTGRGRWSRPPVRSRTSTCPPGKAASSSVRIVSATIDDDANDGATPGRVLSRLPARAPREWAGAVPADGRRGRAGEVMYTAMYASQADLPRRRERAGAQAPRGADGALGGGTH